MGVGVGVGVGLGVGVASTAPTVNGTRSTRRRRIADPDVARIAPVGPDRLAAAGERDRESGTGAGGVAKPDCRRAQGRSPVRRSG